MLEEEAVGAEDVGDVEEDDKMDPTNDFADAEPVPTSTKSD